MTELSGEKGAALVPGICGLSCLLPHRWRPGACGAPAARPAASSCAVPASARRVQPHHLPLPPPPGSGAEPAPARNGATAPAGGVSLHHLLCYLREGNQRLQAYAIASLLRRAQQCQQDVGGGQPLAELGRPCELVPLLVRVIGDNGSDHATASAATLLAYLCGGTVSQSGAGCKVTASAAAWPVAQVVACGDSRGPVTAPAACPSCHGGMGACHTENRECCQGPHQRKSSPCGEHAGMGYNMPAEAAVAAAAATAATADSEGAPKTTAPRAAVEAGLAAAIDCDAAAALCRVLRCSSSRRARQAALHALGWLVKRREVPAQVVACMGHLALLECAGAADAKAARKALIVLYYLAADKTHMQDELGHAGAVQLLLKLLSRALPSSSSIRLDGPTSLPDGGTRRSLDARLLTNAAHVLKAISKSSLCAQQAVGAGAVAVLEALASFCEAGTSRAAGSSSLAAPEQPTRGASSFDSSAAEEVGLAGSGPEFSPGAALTELQSVLAVTLERLRLVQASGQDIVSSRTRNALQPYEVQVFSASAVNARRRACGHATAPGVPPATSCGPATGVHTVAMLDPTADSQAGGTGAMKGQHSHAAATASVAPPVQLLASPLWGSPSQHTATIDTAATSDYAPPRRTGSTWRSADRTPVAAADSCAMRHQQPHAAAPGCAGLQPAAPHLGPTPDSRRRLDAASSGGHVEVTPRNMLYDCPRIGSPTAATPLTARELVLAHAAAAAETPQLLHLALSLSCSGHGPGGPCSRPGAQQLQRQQQQILHGSNCAAAAGHNGSSNPAAGHDQVARALQWATDDQASAAQDLGCAAAAAPGCCGTGPGHAAAPAAAAALHASPQSRMRHQAADEDASDGEDDGLCFMPSAAAFIGMLGQSSRQVLVPPGDAHVATGTATVSTQPAAPAGAAAALSPPDGRASAARARRAPLAMPLPGLPHLDSCDGYVRVMAHHYGRLASGSKGAPHPRPPQPAACDAMPAADPQPGPAKAPSRSAIPAASRGAAGAGAKPAGRAAASSSGLLAPAESSLSSSASSSKDVHMGPARPAGGTAMKRCNAAQEVSGKAAVADRTVGHAPVEGPPAASRLQRQCSQPSLPAQSMQQQHHLPNPARAPPQPRAVPAAGAARAAPMRRPLTPLGPTAAACHGNHHKTGAHLPSAIRPKPQPSPLLRQPAAARPTGQQHPGLARRTPPLLLAEEDVLQPTPSESPRTTPKSTAGGSHRGGGTVGFGGAGTPSGASSLWDSTEALLEVATEQLGPCLLRQQDVSICRDEDGHTISLGEGGVGVVYQGLMHGVDEVAIKVVKKTAPNRAELESFLAEVRVMSCLRHRNVVQLYGACLQRGCLFLVTELMRGGDLYHAIRNSPQLMRWEELGRKVALDIALGLNYLHCQGLAHRDLKSPNVLISEEGVAKISDMGMSRPVRPGDGLSSVQPIMTPLWAAPEVVAREQSSVKADVWSYGIVLFELVTGHDITQYQPLAVTKPLGLVMGPRTVALPESASAVARRIFAACTEVDPDARPTCAEIVAWLRGE